jgi:nicotinate-nucleotide--dimethylbenzimidazole phosphoribosyltransferase
MTIIPTIVPVDAALGVKLRAAVDGLAKPPGSLGHMEDLAVRLGLIQGTLKPSVTRARLMVFAGDHGLTAEGVSRYPAAVTAAMVETFLAGKASANAFARAVDAEMKVIDAGIAQEFPARTGLVQAAVRRGTRSALDEAALTADEVHTALARGQALAGEAAAEGVDILAMGEMGIGNTASAALIMHRLTGIPLERCVGRGAGHDDAGLAHKLSVLSRCAARTSVAEPLRCSPNSAAARLP